MKLKQKEYYYEGVSGTILKCYEPLTTNTLALVVYSRVYKNNVGRKISRWDPNCFNRIKEYPIKNEI